MCLRIHDFFKQILGRLNFPKDLRIFVLILILIKKKEERRGRKSKLKRNAEEGNVRIFGTFYRDPSIFSAIVRLSLRDYFNPTIIHLFIKRSDFILQAYSLRWNRNKWPPKMTRNSEGQTIRFVILSNFLESCKLIIPHNSLSL